MRIPSLHPAFHKARGRLAVIGILSMLALCGAASSHRGASTPQRTQSSATAPKKAYLQFRCVDILDYGADNQGERDSAQAFQAAVQAGAADAICVYIPKGTYRFRSSPTISLPGDKGHEAEAITLRGDGAGVSKLLFDADVNGLALRLNGPRQSFHIRDISILANGNSEATIGLSVMQRGATSPNPAQSDITGVSIHGNDGPGSENSFGRGIYLHQVSNVNVINTAIAGSPDKAPYASRGTCLDMEGTAGSIPIQINIIGSQINYCGHGIHYGSYLQGLQIVGSNFVGNGTAIYQPAGNTGNDQLAITASQFNSGERNIFLSAAIDGVSISASDFYLSQTGSASVEIPGVQFAIQGNTFIQLGSPKATAIAIGPFLLDAGIITGNNFENFNTAVVLQPRSSRVNVQSNAYSNILSEKVVDRGNGNTIGGGSI